jgi:hypothetical protein
MTSFLMAGMRGNTGTVARNSGEGARNAACSSWSMAEVVFGSETRDWIPPYVRGVAIA